MRNKLKKVKQNNYSPPKWTSLQLVLFQQGKRKKENRKREKKEKEKRKKEIGQGKRK
jgi:hypothetical protein